MQVNRQSRSPEIRLQQHVFHVHRSRPKFENDLIQAVGERNQRGVISHAIGGERLPDRMQGQPLMHVVILVGVFVIVVINKTESPDRGVHPGGHANQQQKQNDIATHGRSVAKNQADQEAKLRNRFRSSWVAG